MPGHDEYMVSGSRISPPFTTAETRNELMPIRSTHVPEWMTKGKTILIPKDPSKGTAPNNYRAITCLPIIWKISTAQMKREIYNSLTNRRLFPEEQKACHKGFKGTEELLCVDQHILNESKSGRKKKVMVLIDNKKIYYPTKLDNKQRQNIR